jgi:hypothetical protein
MVFVALLGIPGFFLDNPKKARENFEILIN